MTRLGVECKMLAMELKANEDNYIMGQRDLNGALDETERLYNKVKGKSDDVRITANEFLPDCDLMKLQTRLAKRSAKNYKPDSLVFNPTEFANKVNIYCDPSAVLQTDDLSLDEIRREIIRHGNVLWLELGNVARKVMYPTPPFTFMHGTFDADPAEVIRKKRRMKERDNLGKATKPVSISMKENTDSRDMMIKEAERIFGIFKQLLTKTEDNLICFYEFVTDPTSFARTVENVFTVSLLVKEGYIRILKDTSDLPCLAEVPERERRDRCNTYEITQSIMTVGHDEWKNIVKTFNLENPVIPPRKNARK